MQTEKELSTAETGSNHKPAQAESELRTVCAALNAVLPRSCYHPQTTVRTMRTWILKLQESNIAGIEADCTNHQFKVAAESVRKTIGLTAEEVWDRLVVQKTGERVVVQGNPGGVYYQFPGIGMIPIARAGEWEKYSAGCTTKADWLSFADRSWRFDVLAEEPKSATPAPLDAAAVEADLREIDAALREIDANCAKAQDRRKHVAAVFKKAFKQMEQHPFVVSGNAGLGGTPGPAWHTGKVAPEDTVNLPAGIMPEDVWELLRCRELTAAIHRYYEAGGKPNPAWIEELARRNGNIE